MLFLQCFLFNIYILSKNLKKNTFSLRADGKESLLFDVRFKTGSDTERIPADVHAPFRRVQDDETEDTVQVFGGVLRPSFGVQVNDDLTVTGSRRVKVKLLLELLEEMNKKIWILQNKWY